MRRTYIIGEMAGCHDLKLYLARQLIIVAKEAGCHAAKTQYCSNIKRMARRRNIDNPTVYSRLNFPRHWLSKLRAACDEQHIGFIVSVFLREDVYDVAQQATTLKVASLEASDMELIRTCLNTNKTVLVSTGCMDDADVQRLYRFSDEMNSGQLKILHSTSAYPVPMDQINLKYIKECDGYSDQTGLISTGGLAVAAGAEILEVHYRLDITPPSNPDYPHSLSPGELAEYVRFVRVAEKMCGEDIKKVQPSEEPLRAHRVA